jgi:hypothetical protein
VINKLINYYVHLYIAEDFENDKPRIEKKRMWFLIGNLVLMLITSIGLLNMLITIIGRISGVIK